MKKNLLSVVGALLLSASLFAQKIIVAEETRINSEMEDETEEKSSVFFDGSSYNFIFQWKKPDKSRPISSHWTGIGFAFSKLENLGKTNPVPNLNLSRSYSIVLNLIDYNIPLSGHWVFVSGLGFDWSRYHFKGNIGLQEIDGISQFVKDPAREYESNKLLVYYATIPLLLEYQTTVGHNKHFFIYGGVEGLIKCYSKSQLDIRTSHGIEKANYHNLNLLPISARITCHAGFDDFSIFGYYQPFSLFEKNKGPEIYACGLGLMLNF
ncbi:MAG: PorT family protein [Dysgonamonadaceae bacterium]|jgi:hypothetical protein|nr:PorT family protein [Dysgonamonadaceae bacterium]